jgi:8-oxo-dGTP pyrophosphatase MutT (NUDIX family)
MIPKTAKQVFKGEFFEVYQWQQKTFNGKYTLFEAVKRRPTVQIIATIGDKIILLREEQPTYGKYVSIPGGMFSSFEDKPKSAMLRELKEELGMKPKKAELWKTEYYSKKVEWPTYYYFARDCVKVSEPHLDSGERIKPFLATFEEFVEEASKPDFRNRFFADYMFRLKQDKKELAKLKKMIFKK